MNDYITVETKTWNENKENLFDYESNSYKKNLFTTKTNQIMIYGTSQGNCLISHHQSLNKKEKPLVHILKENSNFKVKSLERDLWMVVSQNQKNKSTEDNYELNEHDILKLGRIQFEIFAFKISDETKKIMSFSENSCDFSEENFCRICYDSKYNSFNPLLSLCDCQGSLKYTHFMCAKEWVNKKAKILEELSNSYAKFDLSKFKCEICSSFMNFFIEENNITYHLLKNIEYFTNYLIFKEEKTFNFTIFNLKVNQELLVGRGFKTHYRLEDNTVSRVHCKIFMRGDRLFIEDCESKFGTLLKIRKSFVVDGTRKIYTLQKDNNLVSIRKTEKKKKILDFCFCGCN